MSINILGAFVYPWSDCANSPGLYVLIEGKVPPLEDFCFQQHGSLFVAERDGLVRYFWEAPDDGTGYGLVTIRMNDGSERALERAWDSRAGVVNHYLPQAPVVDVTIGQDEEAECKPGWTAGFAVTLGVARELVAEFCPGWELAPHTWGEEMKWEPRLIGHGFKDEDGAPYYAMGYTKGMLLRAP